MDDAARLDGGTTPRGTLFGVPVVLKDNISTAPRARPATACLSAWNSSACPTATAT
ncbi:hypothetical protein [Streptomyces mexicanus]|uniref:hypothetical protein n=1 Tax=Streptomyces mexicanus TaxID=178566 RepID=UPI003657E16C